MNENEIFDAVFEATNKLELIKTVIETMMEMTEVELKTEEQALLFAYQENKLNDFLHITHDGVYFAIQKLKGLQEGGAK